MNPRNLSWNMPDKTCAYFECVNALEPILARLQAIHNSPNAPICDDNPNLVHEFLR